MPPQEGEDSDSPIYLEVNLQDIKTAVNNEGSHSTTKDDMFGIIAKASTARSTLFNFDDPAVIHEVLADCRNGEHFIFEVANRAGLTVQLLKPSKGKGKRKRKRKAGVQANGQALERGK